MPKKAETKTVKIDAVLHRRLKSWQVRHGHNHGTMTLADALEDIIKGDLPSLAELEQQTKDN